MKILFLSTWYPFPPDNGSKIRVYHLLQSLAVSHQVSLVSFAFGTAQARPQAGLATDLCQVTPVMADPYDRRRADSPLRFLSITPGTARPMAEMARLVSDQIARTGYDAVIASTFVMAPYALRETAVPVRVLEEHNSLARWMHERYRAQTNPVQRLRCWVSWQKARLFEARLYRQFDLCTVVSDQDRDAALEMLPFYRGPVETVPNGVDCTTNRAGLEEPMPNSLVYNGALTYSANYDAMQFFLAEVYPLIKQQEPRVSLTITGSTTGVNLDGLQLDDTVHLSGYVDDVRPLVAAACICIAPLRDGGGSRLKILEAMSLGTPVIATTKGAEGLEVTPDENILIADAPSEFAVQVLRLLGDPDLRASLTANARRLVEQKYDWAAIGQRFVGLVESAVREHRP